MMMLVMAKAKLELLAMHIYRQQPQATFEIDIFYECVYDKFVGSVRFLNFGLLFVWFFQLVGIFKFSIIIGIQL